ncbi:MAG: HAD hydrolase family protein [Intestinibacter bartlettii]
MKSILDYYHAPYEDAVVFGDNKNDLKMFRDEWTSIAMGNAIDELKERATFVTKDAVD